MNRSVYLSLGDSITRGYDATHPSQTFVGLVGAELERAGVATRTVVVAANGWTSRNLLSAMFTIPKIVWEETSVVTLMIGGNDLRRRYYTILTHPRPGVVVNRAIDEFSYYLRGICETIQSHDVPYRLLHTVYNPVPHAPLAVYAFQKMNETIRKQADAFDFDVIDTHKLFLGKESLFIHKYRTGRLEDLSMPFSRPIHPNDSGHQEIAKLIRERLSQRMRNANFKRSARRVVSRK